MAKQERAAGIAEAAMPRSQEQVEEQLNTKVLPHQVPLPADALAPGSKGERDGKGKFLPYTGRESLPKIEHGSIGESRYFCAPFLGGVDLIAVYTKRNGVGRRLVKVLKDKRDGDKKFRMQLRRMGIPGA